MRIRWDRKVTNTKILLLLFLAIFTTEAFSDKNSSFWDWFEKNESRYFSMDFNNQQEQEKLFDELGNRLEKINENFTFEFGKLDENTMDLVISAGGIEQAFPEVIALVNAAPKLERWKTTAFRQKKDEVSSIQLGGIEINGDNTVVRLYKDGDKIGVVLFLPEYTETPNQVFEQIGFLLLDQTLGEYVVGTKVGFVEFEKNEGVIENSMKLGEMPFYFE